jgi:hypothetical protein
VSNKLSSPLARRRIDMDSVDNFFPESMTNTEFDGIVEDCFTSNEAPTCFLEDDDSLNKTPAKSDSSSGEGKKFGSNSQSGSIGICVCYVAFVVPFVFFFVLLFVFLAMFICLTVSLENCSFQARLSKSTRESICKRKLRRRKRAY